MFIDGKFTCDGKEMSYAISDSSSSTVKIVHGEEKMSRYITLYNTDGSNLGTYAIYGTVDEMTNITPEMACKYYEEFVKSKH